MTLVELEIAESDMELNARWWVDQYGKQLIDRVRELAAKNERLQKEVDRLNTVIELNNATMRDCL